MTPPVLTPPEGRFHTHGDVRCWCWQKFHTEERAAELNAQLLNVLNRSRGLI